MRPMARDRAPIEAVSGHGLISTKWNGCRTIIIFLLKLFTWKVSVLFILRLYKGVILMDKFTVYCLKSATL